MLSVVVLSLLLWSSVCVGVKLGGDFREIGPQPLGKNNAATVVYDQKPFLSPLDGRGTLRCDVDGDELLLDSASLLLSVDGQPVLRAANDRTQSLSQLLSNQLRIRTFQHSTFACVRVEAFGGATIPLKGHLKVSGSFGDGEAVTDGLMGFDKNEIFAVEGDFDLSGRVGPQTVVMSNSVQPEEGEHRAEFSLEDIISEPAVKVAFSPSSSNYEDRLTTTTTVVTTLELLVPTKKLKVWMPPQVRERTQHAISLYVPKRITSTPVEKWRISWAATGQVAFSSPIDAVPGDVVLADGLAPGTVFQFKCCAVHDDRDKDECREIVASTLSDTNKATYADYGTVGMPQSHPRVGGDGTFIIIPDRRTHEAPSTKSVKAVFYDEESGVEIQRASFGDTGTHSITGFQSLAGYRVVFTITDSLNNTFTSEETLKYGPRIGVGLPPLNPAGEPRVDRASPTMLVLQAPEEMPGFSAGPVTTVKLVLTDPISRTVIRNTTFNKPGAQYITGIPSDGFIATVQLGSHGTWGKIYNFILNPTDELKTSSRLFGSVLTRLDDSGYLSVDVASVVSEGGSRIVGGNITVLDASDLNVLREDRFAGQTTIVFRDIPSRKSLLVRTTIMNELKAITTFETFVRRTPDGSLEPQQSVGLPRLQSMTPESFVVSVPAITEQGMPPNIMEVVVIVSDALTGKNVTVVTLPGSGSIRVGGIPSGTIYNVEVVLFRGSPSLPRQNWNTQSFRFVPRSNALPAFDDAGPITVHFSNHKTTTTTTTTTTQQVTVRIPSVPTQLDTFGKIGRADVYIYGQALSDLEAAALGVEPNRTLLQSYIGLETGDTVFENLPSASTTLLSCALKIWTEAQMKPETVEELEAVLEARRNENNNNNTISFIQASHHHQGFIPDFEYDGSFKIVFNATKPGFSKYRGLAIGKQFPSAVPVLLPSPPQYGGAVVVPVASGAIVRLAAYFCTDCTLIESVLIRATHAVEGEEGSCLGKSIGAGQWEGKHSEELFLPMPRDIPVDICLSVTEHLAGGKPKKMTFHIPIVSLEGVPRLPRVGSPNVLSFNDKTVVVRVPHIFYRLLKGRPDIEAPGDDASLEELSRHKHMLDSYTSSRTQQFTVGSGTFEVFDETDRKIATHRIGSGDTVVPLGGIVAGSQLRGRFLLNGKSDDGSQQTSETIISILHDMPAIQAGPGAPREVGSPTLYCIKESKKISLVVPKQLTNQTKPIVRVVYAIQTRGGGRSTPIEIAAGDTQYKTTITHTLPENVGDEIEAWVTFWVQGSQSNLTAYSSVTCRSYGFPTMPPSGSPSLIKTSRNHMFARVPAKVLPLEAAAEKVSLSLRTCESESQLWSGVFMSGGDFEIPTSSVPVVGCLRLSANLTAPPVGFEDAGTRSFEITEVFAKKKFFQPAAEEGNPTVIPLGSGSYLLRCPLYAPGEDRADKKDEKEQSNREVKIEFFSSEGVALDSYQVNRGSDKVVSVVGCWDTPCSVWITTMLGDPETGNVQNVVTVSPLLPRTTIAVPSPTEPDVWTPAPTNLTVNNPANSPVTLKVRVPLTGDTLLDETINGKGMFSFSLPTAGTTYHVTYTYLDQGEVKMKLKYFKTPVREVGTDPNAEGEIPKRKPFPLAILPSSQSVVIHTPELTFERETRVIQAKAILTRDNTVRSSKTLKFPVPGEALTLDSLEPEKEYEIEVMATNDRGETEKTVKRIETTKKTFVYGFSHLITGKTSNRFVVVPSQPLPENMTSMLVSVEDLSTRTPTELYRGLATTQLLEYTSMFPGNRYRVVFSMASDNFDRFDTCAWLTSDKQVNSETLDPHLVRVTNSAVYLALPQFDSLSHYTVHRIDFHPTAPNLEPIEEARVSLYEGKGEEFSDDPNIFGYVARVLEGNTKYNFMVQAHLGDGSTLPSVRIEAWTDSSFIPCLVGRPKKPSAPSIVKNSDREVQVVWELNTANDGPIPDAYPTQFYALETRTLGRNPENNATWQMVNSNLPATSNTHTLTGLTPAYHYEIRVTAMNFFGQSDAGRSLQAFIAREPPEPVRGLLFDSVTFRSAVMSWREPYDNGFPVTKYHVECAPPMSTNPFFYPSDLASSISTYRNVYTGPDLRFLLGGLLPSSRSFCRVRAENQLGLSKFGSGSTKILDTRTTSPEQVIGVGATNIQPNSVEISFLKPRHNGLPLLGFNVHLLDPLTKVFTPVCEYSNTTSCHVTNLNPGQAYSAKVQGFNCRGGSAFSESIDFTTTPFNPEEVTRLSLDSITSRDFSLSWEAGKDNGSPIYEHVLECDGGATCLTGGVYRRSQDVVPCVHSNENSATTEEELVDDTLFRQVYAGPDPKATLSNLLPATTYRCRVFVRNFVGTSPKGSTIEIRTEDAVPDAPSGFNATIGGIDLDLNGFAPMLSWDPAVPNGRPITGYRIEQRNASRTSSSSGLYLSVPTQQQQQWVQISPLDLATTLLSAGSLLADRTYNFRLCAENSVGLSEWTLLEITTPGGRPEMPDNAKLAAKQITSLTVKCPCQDDMGHEITTYHFEVASGTENADGTGTFESFQPTFSGPEATVLFDELAVGTNYKIRCSAENEIGVSPFSNPVMLSTLTGPPDAPPQGDMESANFATTDSLFYRFSLPSDNGALIEKCEIAVAGSWSESEESFVLGVPFETRTFEMDSFSMPYAISYSFTASDLLSNREYSMSFRCINSYGPSTWSQPKILKTLGSAPSAPAEPSLIGPVTLDTARLALGPVEANGDKLSRTKVELFCLEGTCEGSNCNGGVSPTGNCIDPIPTDACVSDCIFEDCLECSLIGLAPGTRYSVRTLAMNPDGWSVPSGTIEFVTVAKAPLKPEMLSFVFSSPSVGTLAWLPPQNSHGSALTAFVVFSTFMEGSQTITEEASVGPTLSEAYLSQLTPGKSYTFALAAENNYGRSVKADSVTVIAPAGRPTQLGAPQLKDRDASSITVQWNPAAPLGAADVEYEIQATKQFSYEYMNATTTATVFTFENLDDTALWQFRVKATNSNGHCGLANSNCGESPFSGLSLAFRTSTSCPVTVETSPSQCSSIGSCDDNTFRCMCYGNNIGEACQFPTVPGICAVSGSIWQSFEKLPAFAHNDMGEFTMYSNSLAFNERVHVSKVPFPGGATAIDRFAFAFEGEKLSVEIDPSDAAACPIIRHNCQVVDSLDYTMTSTDSTGVMDAVRVTSDCSSQVVISNNLTGTVVKCMRSASEPMFFSSCVLKTSRLHCRDDPDCDPWATEEGLCGKEGKSLALAESPLALQQISDSESLFTDLQGEMCSSDSNPTLALLEVPSTHHEAVQTIGLASKLRHVPAPHKHTTSPAAHLAKQQQPQPQPQQQQHHSTSASLLPEQQQQPRPIRAVGVKTNQHSLTPLPLSRTQLVARVKPSNSTDRPTHSRTHRAGEVRVTEKQPLSDQRLSRDEIQQVELQVAVGLDMSNALTIKLPTQQEGLFEAVSESLTGPGPVCPAGCVRDDCLMAINACVHTGPCRASCVSNLCQARCTGQNCAFDWIGLTHQCDAAVTAAAAAAMTEFRTQLREASDFVASLAAGQKVSVDECPEFVSGTEPWNSSPEDKNVAVWNDQVVDSVSN